MTEYVAHSAHSAIGSDSTVRAHRVGSWVHVTSKSRGASASTALEADDARKFARGILALADEIDGGEADAMKPEIKVGDKVRIVRNSPWDGDKHVGRVGVLASVDSHDHVMPYRVSFPDDSYGWWCAEVELVDTTTPTDEPAPAVEPGLSAFAAHVEEALSLLAGTTYTGADVITLARELADRA